MGELIPRGNGDGVFTGRDPHNSQETIMAEYGKPRSAPKEKPATAEEVKWIETAAKHGEQLTLQEARKQMNKYGTIGVIFFLVFFWWMCELHFISEGRSSKSSNGNMSLGSSPAHFRARRKYVFARGRRQPYKSFAAFQAPEERTHLDNKLSLRLAAGLSGSLMPSG